MKAYLLFDEDGPRIGPEDGYEAAPVLDTLESLVAALRAGQERLRRVPIGDLLGLCDAAARAWTQPEHPMADFIRHGWQMDVATGPRHSFCPHSFYPLTQRTSLSMANIPSHGTS